MVLTVFILYLCCIINMLHEVNPLIEERAILIGIIRDNQTAEQVDEYLDELAFLAETAGAVTVKKFTQKLKHPDVRYFVGSGKMEEIKAYKEYADVNTIIIDDEISPAQQRNLEEELKCKILDRTSLILDIFAMRAQTAQARTQVELAQMQYLLPRLQGLWTHL